MEAHVHEVWPTNHLLHVANPIQEKEVNKLIKLNKEEKKE